MKFGRLHLWIAPDGASGRGSYRETRGRNRSRRDVQALSRCCRKRSRRGTPQYDVCGFSNADAGRTKVSSVTRQEKEGDFGWRRWSRVSPVVCHRKLKTHGRSHSSRSAHRVRDSRSLSREKTRHRKGHRSNGRICGARQHWSTPQRTYVGTAASSVRNSRHKHGTQIPGWGVPSPGNGSPGLRTRPGRICGTFCTRT